MGLKRDEVGTAPSSQSACVEKSSKVQAAFRMHKKGSCLQFFASVFLRILTSSAAGHIRGSCTGKNIDPVMLFAFLASTRERAAMMQVEAVVAGGWNQQRWNEKCTPEEKNCTFMDYAQKLRIVRVRSLVCIDEYLIFLNTAPATLDISAGF